MNFDFSHLNNKKDEDFLKACVYEYLAPKPYMEHEDLVSLITLVTEYEEKEVIKVLNLMADLDQIDNLDGEVKNANCRDRIRLTQYARDEFVSKSTKIKKYILFEWIAILALIVSVIALFVN